MKTVTMKKRPNMTLTITVGMPSPRKVKRSGQGTHGNKATKRCRTRSAQSRKALSDG